MEYEEAVSHLLAHDELPLAGLDEAVDALLEIIPLSQSSAMSMEHSGTEGTDGAECAVIDL